MSSPGRGAPRPGWTRWSGWVQGGEQVLIDHLDLAGVSGALASSPREGLAGFAVDADQPGGGVSSPAMIRAEVVLEPQDAAESPVDLAHEG